MYILDKSKIKSIKDIANILKVIAPQLPEIPVSASKYFKEVNSPQDTLESKDVLESKDLSPLDEVSVPSDEVEPENKTHRQLEKDVHTKDVSIPDEGDKEKSEGLNVDEIESRFDIKDIYKGDKV